MKLLLLISALFCFGSIILYTVDSKPKPYEVPDSTTAVTEWLPYPALDNR